MADAIFCTDYDFCIGKARERKEKQIVCIPAHAYKVISEYKVSPRFVKTCERTKDFPKRTAIVASYSEGSSPVKFKNRIAYSFDSDCKNLQHIENNFYVSGVTNYSKKAAVEKVREQTDCYSTQKQKRAYFKIGGPDKFYKTYRSRGVNGSVVGESMAARICTNKKA